MLLTDRSGNRPAPQSFFWYRGCLSDAQFLPLWSSKSSSFPGQVWESLNLSGLCKDKSSWWFPKYTCLYESGRQGQLRVVMASHWSHILVCELLVPGWAVPVDGAVKFHLFSWVMLSLHKRLEMATPPKCPSQHCLLSTWLNSSLWTPLSL